MLTLIGTGLGAGALTLGLVALAGRLLGAGATRHLAAANGVPLAVAPDARRTAPAAQIDPDAIQPSWTVVARPRRSC